MVSPLQRRKTNKKRLVKYHYSTFLSVSIHEVLIILYIFLGILGQKSPTFWESKRVRWSNRKKNVAIFCLLVSYDSESFKEDSLIFFFLYLFYKKIIII